MKIFNCISTAVIMAAMVHGAFPAKECSPCDCYSDSFFEGSTKAVCSGLNLSRIPPLPRETTTLLLDNNNLTYLPPMAFSGMKKLKHLDLSDNRLLRLGEYVFNGLHQLEELILDGNYFFALCSLSVFDPVFLKPLMKLHTFSLLGQKKSCGHFTSETPPLLYSGTSYSDNLQYLYIDCYFCRFESSFQRLTKLVLLSLTTDRNGMGCALYEMDNSTFKHTPYLETLNISDCQVTYARPGIFDPLQNLRKLDMSMFLVAIDEINVFIEATKSLRLSQIEYIKFVSFRSVQTNPDLFSYLQNTTLKQLHITGILFPLIELNTFKKLPESLEILTLLHFQYSTAAIFNELRRHPSLKVIDLSNVVLSEKYDSYSGGATLFSLPPLVETYICKSCHYDGYLGSSGSSLIPYDPPEMRIKHVKNLIIPDNGITYFATYTYDQLPFVEHIDISYNRLDDLLPFSSNNTISYLNVAGNRLGNFLANDNTSTLESLSKLQTVDFSDNNVFSLSTTGLDQLRSVRVINVSNNFLETVNIRLSHLTYLEVLDLSKNKIHAIGEDTRNDLSRLPKARVHLNGNPLVCGCDELDSLQWMKQNRKRVHNLKSLNCRLSNGIHDSFSNLDKIITDLQTLCNANFMEISVSVSVTVSVLSLVAGVLVYRHRWKLRYLYYAGRRGYRRRYNHEYIHLEDYQYDAFISYADPDRAFVFKEMVQELEEKHGLKLCVHHRDFLPGEIISDNIVNAIQNSRKTVVVLSPSFLKSDWCEFEFNMARMEGVTRRQDIVLMLLYEDVSMMNLNKDMASMLKRNCYLEYNHELFNKEIFWYNVQESIQTIRQRD